MIFCIILFHVIIPLTVSNKLNIHMVEETPVNTEIGSILASIPMHLRGSNLQYEIESKFFTITENAKVLVKKKIDLENICLQHKVCCGTVICTIEASILIQNKDGEIITNIELQVQILDKNDHKPVFRSNEESTMISEYAQVGVLISLTPATDGDATNAFRIQSYKLFEPTNTFLLDVSRLPSISLKVSKKLDFEERNQYEGSLQACDEEVCATQRLVINIKDENDNLPVFEHEAYNFTVKEDLGIGITIGEVKATDKDSGKLGEIRYFISADSDIDLQSTFSVDMQTGKIRLKQRLSTNTRDRYKFAILAKDFDPLNPKQSMCYVFIVIEDVNDHRPIIKIFSNSGPFNISENVGPRYITTLKITDDDQGKNGIVECRLEPNSEGSFELILNSKNVYSLKNIRKFDHELEQKLDAVIICKDQGEPSLDSRKVIPIYVTDQNEYRPHFKPNDPSGTFRADVMENSEFGKKVITIIASDRDKSAELRYQIDNYGTEYFEIDPKSGVIICANNMLDREKLSSIKFTVHVTDSLTDPKTASIELKITVLDVNDNPPLFRNTLHQFSVIENTEPTRLVGQIFASDADQDENGLVTFSLVNTWNANTLQRFNTLFHVVTSGHIETLKSLDRELCDLYILEIVASDSARPPQIPLTSVINVTLRVLDENDETPTWTYPDLNTYNISDAMKPGDHFIQLQASDKDIGLNGKIRFDIISQYRKEDEPSSNSPTANFHRYFTVNSTTGHLWISQLLHAGTVIVLFRASDHGQPVKYSDIKLIINISGVDSSNLNMTIIAVMITVTAVISFFLIVAIICVRRKPPKYHSPTSSILTKEQPVPDWIGLNSDESLMAFPTGNKSPFIRNPHRVPFNPQAYDGTMQMHNFTSNCLPYEPIDGDSGDSGKGPSEEGSNTHHLSQEGPNYFTLRQPIRGGPFRQCGPIPASPSRSTCHCYVLPEETMVQPGQSTVFPPYSHGDAAILADSSLNNSVTTMEYSNYNSLSLPRYHFSNSGSKFNSNSTLKFQHYTPIDSMFLKDHYSQMAPSNSSDSSTPKIRSKITPMHIRKLSEKEVDTGFCAGDDRSSSLVTSTTSAASSTKTVLYNGQPTINSIQSNTESVPT